VALLAVFCLLALRPAAGLAQASAEDPVSLDAELFSLPSGDPSGRLLAVLRLTPAPGWHAYSADSAEAGQPAQATLSAGNARVRALFPPGAPRPDAFEPDKTVLVYDQPTPIFVPLSASVSGAPALTGQVRIFSCSDVSCWPSSININLPLAGRSPDNLPQAASSPWWPQFLALRQAEAAVAAPGRPAALDPVAPAAETAPAGPIPAESAYTPRFFTPALEVSGLVKAAALAFLAGFVLNFMPCVLPVVSLKLSGLLAICGEEGRHERIRMLREHNFFFALGIVVYFLILSTLLGAFGLAWGEMFQSSSLILATAVVLFALSLSLFGVFHLPVVDLKVPAGGRGHTRRGAFLTGVLATLLATPCSGPFLGGVLAWTLLQPLPVITTVFAAIGLGMAAPYAVLAIWPRLARFLPRPGNWMTGLERAMGFVLAATCIYFLSLVPHRRLPLALVALWATGLGAYIYGKGANLSQSLAKRLTIRSLAVTVAGAGLALALVYSPPGDPKWVAYTPEAFQSRLGRENLVVDFTADWCPTCKFLERTVLTPARLADWSKRHDAVFMKVDLTNRNPETMEFLRGLGSQSIPVVAFFPAGATAGSPLVLRDLYTTGQFAKALAEAFAKTP
jgi:thiol:disulfide interchange protein DsbD